MSIRILLFSKRPFISTARVSARLWSDLNVDVAITGCRFKMHLTKNIAEIHVSKAMFQGRSKTPIRLRNRQLTSCIMNVVEITVQDIHPDPSQRRMLGKVVFRNDFGSDAPNSQKEYLCACPIPKGDTADIRFARIKQALIMDAIRQTCTRAETVADKENRPSFSILPQHAA